MEDALAKLQSTISTETHPLLRGELFAVKSIPDGRNECKPQPLGDALTETMDALGTLTIGDSGESTYFGRSAGSEVCQLLI